MMNSFKTLAGIALISIGATLAAYAPMSASSAHPFDPTGPLQAGELCVPGTIMTGPQMAAACAKTCGNCVATGSGPLWGWNNGECLGPGPGCTRGVSFVEIPMYNCNSSWCGTSFWTGQPQYLCTTATVLPKAWHWVSDCI